MQWMNFITILKFFYNSDNRGEMAEISLDRLGKSKGCEQKTGVFNQHGVQSETKRNSRPRQMS